jgi:nuclear transport factor 2 (NTF2) superfamily protein
MAAPTPPRILPPFDQATARLKVQLAEDAWNTLDPERVALAYTEELWAFTDNRISVRFVYESRDTNGQWWRSHGNEHWEFDEASGLMRCGDASINDYPIAAVERSIALP